MGTLEILPLVSDKQCAWDQYVDRSRESGFAHTLAWKRLVERTYRFTPHYLLAEQEGRVAGILPMFSFSHPLFGRGLVSVPGANVAGICADDAQTAAALGREAVSVARSLDCSVLEYRGGQRVADTTAAGAFVTHRLDLSNGEEAAWSSLRKRARQSIRRAERSGVEVLFDAAQLPEFYELYLDSMRRYGSPPYPYRFFEALVDEFGRTIRLGIARWKQRPVAGEFWLLYRKELVSLNAGSNSAGREHAAPYLLCWRAMQSAIAEGVSILDFGRSPTGSTAITFKENFAATPRALGYRYWTVSRRSPPVRNPDAPRYRLARAFLRQLPRPLSQRLGAAVIWYLH